MVNSRLRLVKSEDNQKTDMQIAVEEIMGDRATTPTMKKRKVDVLLNDNKQKEDEKNKEKEDKMRKEIEDAIKGKRYIPMISDRKIKLI